MTDSRLNAMFLLCSLYKTHGMWWTIMLYFNFKDPVSFKCRLCLPSDFIALSGYSACLLRSAPPETVSGCYINMYSRLTWQKRLLQWVRRYWSCLKRPISLPAHRLAVYVMLGQPSMRLEVLYVSGFCIGVKKSWKLIGV